MTTPARSITVLSHRRPEQTAATMAALEAAAAAVGATLHVDDDAGADDGAPAAQFDLGAGLREDAELCVALGGDGTILRALRRYAGTQVPVFAVNFGEVGFLATVEPQEAADGFAAAMQGAFDVVALPALGLDVGGRTYAAVNDVSLHRRPGARIAQLSYGIGEDELGSVRCDGLVVATPAGSTGYNLANGGPVLAWGVEGFVVSFIAPHSLTARALVVSPDDVLTVHNRSPEPVDVSVDGKAAGALEPGHALTARFMPAAAHLAVIPGSSFYRRLRTKFGRLSA